MEKLTIKEHSYFTESVIKSLIQNRIITLIDFLQEDTVKLSALTKLALPQIFEIRCYLLAKYAAPVVCGKDLFLNRIAYRKRLTTGINSLDTILTDGIPIGFITEICGLAGSGKTQLCLQLAINCVKCSDDTVLYIDTKGDFSAMRIQQILEARSFSAKDMATIMLKIKIVHIWNLEQLIKLLEEIKSGVIVIQNLSLIFIDSLPCLMFQHLGDDNKIGLKFLNIFVNYARYLSKEFKVGVICVNIQTRWIEQDNLDAEDDQQLTYTTKEIPYIEKLNRCLGKYWQHIPAVVMFMEKYQDPDKDNKCYTKLTVTYYNDPLIKRTCILETSSQGIT